MRRYLFLQLPGDSGPLVSGDYSGQCVLKGFTKCSVPTFIKVFENMLVQYEQACVAPGARFVSPFGQPTPFHDITHSFTVGLALHKNLSGTGQWNVPKGRVNVSGLEIIPVGIAKSLGAPLPSANNLGTKLK